MNENGNMLRAIVITRVALAGALFCTVMVGAGYALFTGADAPAGVDIVVALSGAAAAGVAKAASFIA